MGTSTSHSLSDKNTNELLRMLLVTAIVSILLILSVSSYGFYRIFSGYVVASAEQDGIKHCEILVRECQDDLFKHDQHGMSVFVEPHKLPVLDQKLRQLLPRYQIIKVKIYDASQRIVYSTEKDIIGLVDSANPRLQRAMQGKVDSQLETSKKIHDLSEERVITADVVETYIPIRNMAGRPVGSFEVYMNVSKYKQDMQHGLIMAVSLLAMVSMVVFGSSFIMIRSSSLHLREYQERLELMAITDVLTGLANRRHLLERGEEEFLRNIRKNEQATGSSSLGCIMIDIDHFKKINDNHGHLIGDHVIRELARRLDLCMRPYDIVGRYGGEEFVVLLSDTSFENCHNAAERIRQAIRTEPFQVDQGSIRVTISLGIACSSKADCCLNDILKRADQAMYKAKEGGRDQVASA